MPSCNFIAIGFGLCRGNTGADVNIASLAENLDKIKFDQKKFWTKEMRREESRESSMATASTAVRAMGSDKI